MIALFNQEKKFVGYSQDDLPFPNLLRKQISEECSDLNLWKWSGDYDTGQMVSINEEGHQLSKNNFDERKKALENIFNKYPLEIQVLHTMQQLYNVVKNTPSANDVFMDMVEEIVATIEKYKIDLK